MSDLIFVSLENWDQIWRRNQFLVAEMARRDPGRTILFVGPARDVSYGVRTRRLPFGSDGARVRPPFDTIRLFRPLKLLPYTLALGRGANQILERVQVRRAARRLELARPILWLNPHQAHHYAGRLGESCVVYDITDDWISLTQKSWLRELTRWQDEQLCRKADAVIVCSEKLYKMKQNLSTNLHLIPNGVDAAHYASVLQSGPLPAPAQVWRKPVLGYTGTLHPDRVDVPPEKFVEAIAKHKPRVVGMSVLLTTCFKSVIATVEAIKQAGLRESVAIMVGGAAASDLLRQSAGCDFYGKSAVDGVKFAGGVAV